MATGYNTQYQHSSAARRLKEIPDSGFRKSEGRKPHKGAGMRYVLFVTVALAFTAFILTKYISLRADVTNRLNHISSLETQLNDLKLENDATYSRINSSMDLEEIRDTAINELGMIYAREGQIETFTSENGDYVRQVSQIPD